MGLALLAVFGQFNSIDQAVKNSALHSATIISRSLSEFREIYSREVVSKLVGQGIKVSHDFHNKADTIPLPATAAMMIGRNISNVDLGISTKLYSPYPFPWRRNEFKGDFQQQAWQALSDDKNAPFYRFLTTKNGQKKLFYATADVLKPSCVECHNTHPDSPKRDWREGDLRGILEVELNLSTLRDKAQEQALPLIIITSLGLLLALMALVISIYSLRNKSTELKQEVVAQTEKLRDNILLLETEVQQHKGTLLSLERSKLDAQQANQAKSEFLMKMSHEFRTPLNAIIGFSQRLLNKLKSTVSEREYSALHSIHNSGNSLLDLVNTLIDFSKIENNRLPLELKEVDLDQMCRNLCSDFSDLAEENGNQLKGHESSPACITSDPILIKQILLNLLGNAIKNTHNGTIALKIISEQYDEQAGFTLSVTDSGTGIVTEDLDQLFDLFFQVKKDNTFSAGTGLGLSIVKELTTRLEGHMHVTSELGKGSCFSLWLPQIHSHHTNSAQP